jgi:hypothetical protein
MRSPRIAIVGVWLESNRQAPVATHDDFKSYYYLEGATILDAARMPNPSIMGEAAAFVNTMDATGPWTLIPILLIGCHPHGPVDGQLMDHFLETVRAGLAQAGTLDTVYIANHGAMLATNDEDPAHAGPAGARQDGARRGVPALQAGGSSIPQTSSPASAKRARRLSCAIGCAAAARWPTASSGRWSMALPATWSRATSR